MKEQFLKLAKEHIKREGVEKLLEYLETTDFFTAPASTKYHSSFEGGLCAHSINVFNRLVKNLQNEYGDDWEKVCNIESAAIIGLFHDICKANTYTVDQKNVKEYSDGGSKVDNKGRYDWVTKDVYMVDDQLPYGHGEKSVYMLSGFIKLKREEAMAINWHMGGYDLRVKGGFALSEVLEKYPLVLLTNISDLQAAYLDEKREK